MGVLPPFPPSSPFLAPHLSLDRIDPRSRVGVDALGWFSPDKVVFRQAPRPLVAVRGVRVSSRGCLLFCPSRGRSGGWLVKGADDSQKTGVWAAEGS